MVMSVNTNTGALIALQNLTKTNRELEEVQKRISTGFKVNTAKDNGAVFAIAQNMRAEIGGLGAIQTALDRSTSVVDVAIAAAESVSSLLIQMKELTVAAMDSSIDIDTRKALSAGFIAMRQQITTIVESAEFNGSDLLQRTSSDLNVLLNDNGDTLTITAQDMSVSDGLAINASVLTSAGDANTARQAIEAAIQTVSNKLSALGTGSKSMDIHNVFVTKISDSLTTGLGNLVDADLAKESASLQALQIRQQLGTQALSIANSAPQQILALFQ